MSLTQSLEKLVDVLDSKGITMRERLRPGLTRTEIQAALTPLGLTPPEELYELYEWHDGVEDWDTPGNKLFYEWQFLPFKNAVEEYLEYRQYYSGKGYEDLSIDLNQCFPFAFFMGDICTIYCDPTLVLGMQHPVIGIYHDIAVSFENIDLMAQTVIAWWAAGICDTDEPVDTDVWHGIRRKLNARIPDPNPGL